MKILAISPTYNESENISKHIENIFSLDIKIDLLVIDDSSPDGTSEIVKEKRIQNKGLYLLERSSKQGLGTAYIAGFDWAVKNNYDAIIQIDADLSHDPKDIISMVQLLDEYDMVIGSRYVNGVNVVNWPLRRLILSYLANVYARVLLGIKLKDLTSGYNCFKTKILEKIRYKKIASQGYSFQIELKYLSYINKFLLHEHPIIFHDRTVGYSKMSKNIIIEAIFKVLILKFKKMLNLL